MIALSALDAVISTIMMEVDSITRGMRDNLTLDGLENLTVYGQRHCQR